MFVALQKLMHVTNHGKIVGKTKMHRSNHINLKDTQEIESVINTVCLYLDLIKVQIMHFLKQHDEMIENFRKQSFG